jgi:hypothetical protein
LTQDTPTEGGGDGAHGDGGDRRTASALARLGEVGWSVAHPIRRGHGDLDHVAVGPGGTYVLASRHLHGVVEVRDGVPWLERRHDPPASTSLASIRPRVLSAAARLEKELAERCSAEVVVQAVVVLWAEFPARVLEDGPCVFIDGEALAGWLEARPKLLAPEQIPEIGRALQQLAARNVSGALRAAPS